MKKTLIYSAFILLLASVACNKTDSAVSEEPIRFAFATDAATRSLVESDAMLRSTQAIKVYDDMGSTPYYIDDSAIYTSLWTFESGRTYTWRTGDHKFFAYTNANAFGTLSSAQKVSVSKTLTADPAEVDLLYSDIVTKTKAADTKITEAVEIPMNHLFAAVSVMVKNGTSNAVTVKSITAPEFKNSGSATIDFSGTNSSVSYGTISKSGSYATGTISNLDIAAGKMADVLTAETADDYVYGLIWPQSIAANAYTVDIEYTMGGKTFTSSVSLPAAATTWVAGYKYAYTLTINPNAIELTFTVKAWVEETEKNLIVE